jgi:radical SAM superfamily enzyme YgiQ (UPF0313 family)
VGDIKLKVSMADKLNVSMGNHELKDHYYLDPASIVSNYSQNELTGVRCLLINMPIREQALPNNAPLGLCLIASNLIKHGAYVEILDMNSYRIHDNDSIDRGLENGRVFNESEARETIEKYLSNDVFEMVALSGLITTLKWQKIVVDMIRDISPKSYLISGGGLATEFREELFNWIPELDAIAHSEGDEIALKIARDAKYVYDSRDNIIRLDEIVGPARTLSKNGREYATYEGGRPKNLDDVSEPAWHLLENDRFGNNILEKYIKIPVWGNNAGNSSAVDATDKSLQMKRSLNSVSSRGCPFACKFCFRGAQGERNYGVRSAGNIFSELIKYKQKYDIDFLGFVDDNFAVSRKRIFEMRDLMGEWCEGNNLYWGTHARLDEAADIKKVEEGGGIVFNNPLRVKGMYDSGCRYIGFGAESASPRMLDRMGKGGFILTHGVKNVFGHDVPVTMMEGIKNTVESGINANCTWIMGYPSETLDDLKASVAFIKWQEFILASKYEKDSEEYRLACASVNKNLFVATAYPGTDMFKEKRVQEKLIKGFGITFVNNTPVCDSNLERYVEQLNDATDIIYTDDGGLLQYSDISDQMFMEIRDRIENNDIFSILDL